MPATSSLTAARCRRSTGPPSPRCAARSGSCSSSPRCSIRCRCSTTSPSVSGAATCRTTRSPRAREALALVDLTGAEERLPAELSGGMRKRVGIARAIAVRPRYILYDEPTTGLDPVTAAVIDQLMVRTREHLQVTGIVVTHDMRSAFPAGDRIAMLY